MSGSTSPGPTYVDVRASLAVGWKGMTENFLQFAFVMVLMVGSSLIFVSLALNFSHGLLHLLWLVLEVVAPVVFAYGLFRLALPIADGVPVTFRDVTSFVGLQQYVIASAIVIVPVLVLGTLSLGVVFVLAGPLLMFFPFFVLDRESAAWKSIKQSWTAGAVHYAALFKLSLAVIGLTLLGFITLVGWLLTIPMVAIAVAHAYRSATGPSGSWK